MTTAAAQKPADTLGITEAEQVPAAATPAAKKEAADPVNTLQLIFRTDEEKAVYNRIVKDAAADDRKAHIFLLRWVKQNYGK